MKNNFFKRILLAPITICIIVSLIMPTFSSIVWPQYEDELNSEAAFVIDKDSDVILYEKNSDEKLYPASLTKIMTAIIVLDQVKGNYDELVTFSYTSVTKDLDKNSATIGASAGDQLSIKDCLYSLLLPSANDVANALAEHIAGSTKDFVALMNEKAKNMGLTNTHFANPSGLHNDEQYTTAHDMAIIFKYAMQYPIFMQISSSVSYRHAPIRKYKNPENSNNQVLNTNSIMVRGSGYYYNGVTAGKTGHTSLAGYNLAVSCKKNNMHLICVLLKANSEKNRFNDAKKLFDFLFKNYKSLSVKDIDDRFKKNIDSISINDVDLVKTLSITCSDTAHITMPIEANIKDINSHLEFIVKDVYNKYAIGYIDYMLFDKLIGSATLEGRNPDNNSSIFTSNLNFSKSSSDDDVITNKNTNRITNYSNRLVYRDMSGRFIVSKTLITVLTVILILILLILVFIFLYSRVLTNTNFPTTKILFRLRRFLRKRK